MRLEAFLEQRFGLTEEEKEFIKDSETATTATMNKTRNISEMYLSKTIEKSTTDMMNSNETLSRMGNEYTKKLGWYTLALVGVGALQFMAALLNYFK